MILFFLLLVRNSYGLGDIDQCPGNVLQNTNCAGMDIKHWESGVLSPTDCCNLCLNTSGCVAWTWNRGGNKFCYAKSGCDNPTADKKCISGTAHTPFFPFRNVSLPLKERIQNLISLLTVAEKTELISTSPSGILRLGINAYSFELECDSGACGGSGGSIFYNACNGVCSTDNLTAFPQSSGMAATWNTTLIELEGNAIGVEVRTIAANNLANKGTAAQLRLSCFSPMINIIRDPMWCRNSEGYSECPVLTGELAYHMVRGMQGNNPHYVQVVAGCKHFVPYDGPAADHSSDYDLFGTYLFGFKKCMDASALNVMCSYTKSNYAGTSSCTNSRILNNILRSRYNFDGFVISDLGAVNAGSPSSLAAGMDVYLGKSPDSSTMEQWLKSGTILPERLNEAVSRSLLPRFLEGEFDPHEIVPYWNTTTFSCDKIGSPTHRQLAYEAAVQSLVLLLNDGTLPISQHERIAVVGPFGVQARWMFNRYSHVPSKSSGLLVSLYDALQHQRSNTTSAPGCTDYAETTSCTKLDTQAVDVAISAADVVVVAVGNGEKMESETTCEDVKVGLALPGLQETLINHILAKNSKKVVVVLFTTAPKNGIWMKKVNAVIQAYYPQNSGGLAIADVLLGNQVPSGKLTTTWPETWDKDKPKSGRLYMNNITYRYGQNQVLFPFGYGLSFTEFKYSNLKVDSLHVSPCGNITVSVTVTNVGNVSASEIIQVYIKWNDIKKPVPIIQLAAFSKVWIKSGTSSEVSLTIQPRQFAVLSGASTTKSQFLDSKNISSDPIAPTWIVTPTTLHLFVGGQQPHQQRRTLSNVLNQTVIIDGPEVPLSSCPGSLPS